MVTSGRIPQVLSDCPHYGVVAAITLREKLSVSGVLVSAPTVRLSQVWGILV